MRRPRCLYIILIGDVIETSSSKRSFSEKVGEPPLDLGALRDPQKENQAKDRIWGIPESFSRDIF